MSADEELLLALAKGLIGSAAHLALPGLGSLVMIGFSKVGNNQADLNKELSKELVESFRVVGPRKKASLSARVKSAVSRSEKGEARRLLDSGVELGSMISSAGQTLEQATGSVGTRSDTDGQDWAALGKAQLAMVSSPAFVPGVWQDEFAALLQAICEQQLEEGAAGAEQWHQLIGVEEGQSPPNGANLTNLMRTVTRVFAARITANSKLEPLARELHQSDRAAMQYALLYRLDQQRQSLQLIAAALCALLIALGIEVDVLQ